MKAFFQSILKITSALVLAALALAIVSIAVAWGVEAHKKREARPYEEVREWRADLTDALNVKMVGRTKLSGGTMYAKLDFEGYPPPLEYAINKPQDGTGFILSFLDKDGFELKTRLLKLQDGMRIAGKAGKFEGLQYSYDEYMPLETYARIADVKVGWNFKLESASAVAAPAIPPAARDHCEPNISKAERLKRLALNGQLRQLGPDHFFVGSKSVSFFERELLTCN